MQENKPKEVAEYRPIEAALAELRNKYQGVVFPVSTTSGDKEARVARRELVGLRTSLETRRVEIKAPILALAKAIDTEAKRLTSAIEALETPIDAQIKAEEARQETERAAKAAAAAAKAAAAAAALDALRAKVKAIADTPLAMLGKTPVEIAASITALEFLPVTDIEFEELVCEASTARDDALVKLRAMHTQAIEREEEEKRLAAEREEMERQRKEQEARLAAERQELERQRQEQEARLAAERQAMERQRQEQEAREAEQKRQQEAADREATRVREEAERVEKERRQLEAQREEQVRREQEAAARKEADAKAARQREIEKAETIRMDAQEMLNAFSARYGHLEEFAGVNKAIASYFAQIKAAA